MKEIQASYRTLKVIDGQEYISVSEHEDIVSKLTDFNKAMEDVRTAIATVKNSTKEVTRQIQNIKI